MKRDISVMCSPLQAALSSLFRTTSLLGVTFDRCLNWPKYVRHIKTSALPSPTSSVYYVVTPVNAESYIFVCCMMPCVSDSYATAVVHTSPIKKKCYSLEKYASGSPERVHWHSEYHNHGGNVGRVSTTGTIKSCPQDLLSAEGIRLPRSSQLSP